jgi:hypothetical protein
MMNVCLAPAAIVLDVEPRSQYGCGFERRPIATVARQQVPTVGKRLATRAVPKG